MLKKLSTSALRIGQKMAILVVGMLLAGFIAAAAGSAHAAPPAKVDILSGDNAALTMALSGLPDHGSFCVTTTHPGENRESTVAEFAVRPYTTVYSVKTNWGDKWNVNGQASENVVMTGLSDDETKAGNASITLPHGLSGNVEVCFGPTENAPTQPYGIIGLGVNPTDKNVNLMFVDGPAYSQTITEGNHHYLASFLARNMPADATSTQFTVHPQTKVEGFIVVKPALGGPAYTINLVDEGMLSCAGNVCKLQLPYGTTFGHWPAPVISYDWDGTGTEPKDVGLDIAATNAMTP